MKGRLLMLIMIPMLLFGCGTGKKRAEGDGAINFIFETDMGNDVDDALALDMIYKYHEAGKINLLAICLNKEGSASGEYIDIMNTWYGHPDIPIGIIHDGADCENDGVNYAKAVVNMKDQAGKPLFPRTLTDYDNLPESVQLYRRILSEVPDKSVVIASVGFSTNLARLLQTGPDKYSKLDGKALVEKKVKTLVTMAGNITELEDVFSQFEVGCMQGRKKRKNGEIRCTMETEEWHRLPQG